MLKNVHAANNCTAWPCIPGINNNNLLEYNDTILSDAPIKRMPKKGRGIYTRFDYDKAIYYIHIILIIETNIGQPYTARGTFVTINA